MHTASFWNITIQWTSHDDLTEKICNSWILKKIVKSECKEGYLNDLTEFLKRKFVLFLEEACLQNLHIDLEVKRMDGFSWKKNSNISALPLFVAA